MWTACFRVHSTCVLCCLSKTAHFLVHFLFNLGNLVPKQSRVCQMCGAACYHTHIHTRACTHTHTLTHTHTHHKAFDCINHDVLLEKLKFYGVSGKFYNLVKLCLNGRYQKVILSHNNSIESTWEKVKQGVAQGSILGSIFFLTYINDLPKLATIGTKILLYADDTSIIVTS